MSDALVSLCEWLLGKDLPAGLERGLRRIVFVVSLVVAAFGFNHGIYVGSPAGKSYGVGVFWAVLVGSIPWLLFFLARWIIQGFRR